MTTTTRLRLARHWVDRPLVIVGAALVIVLVAGLASAWSHRGELVSAAPVATVALPNPIIIIASPTPAAQVANVGPNVTTRAIVAYQAPGGAVAGAVEVGRHFGYLARSGPDWVYLAIDGSGDLWVKSADLMGTGDLADVATPTSAPAPIVVSAPIEPETFTTLAAPTPQACYQSERQAMVQGVSVGLAVGDSCISQQQADEQAAEQAFRMMNQALQTQNHYANGR